MGTIGDKLRAAPLLCALVPVAAGIALGTLIVIPFYVWAVSTVVCAATAWLALASHTRVSTFYVALAILLSGTALARAHLPRPIVPQGERVWMEVVLSDDPAHREDSRSASAHGTVVRWQEDARTPSDEWRTVRERLLVSIDTVWNFEAGDVVAFRGYVNPISDTANSYSRLMRARGYTGRTYISQYSMPALAPAKAKRFGAWARKLQSGATERLLRLGGGDDGSGDGEGGGDGEGDGDDGDGGDKNGGRSTLRHGRAMQNALAVAAAMTTGDRAGITPSLRRAYSRTGASHLLAVSGLHVGIVFLMINALFYLLPLAPRGHILKNIAAVAAIWLYAALTGLSPSATRAAFMFTGAQIALATSQARNGANIMSGTALVMLAVKPGLLFDISFQLSFIAVAAIMAWFGPLYRLVKSRFRLLNALWATLIVGLVASAATMPLVSHTFGVFSPVGIVLNPLVIATAHITVGFSLLWIAAPLPPLEPLFGWLVGSPAWLQNRVVESVAGVSGAAVEWTMPLWMVFVCYAAITILTAWYHSGPHRDYPFVLPR